MAWHHLTRCLVNDAHQVLLFHLGVLTNDLPGHPTILGQHQEAHRVDIEPPRRRQATQLRRRKSVAAGVVTPVRAGVDQCHRGRVAILGLAAHISDGLVQQDGDALLLETLGNLVYVDAVGRQHLHAHLGHLAIDLHPALGDPVVRLAPRAQAQLGHALVQAGADHAVHGDRRGRPFGRLLDGRNKRARRRAVVGGRGRPGSARRRRRPDGSGFGGHGGTAENRTGCGCRWCAGTCSRRRGSSGAGRRARTGRRRHCAYFRLRGLADQELKKLTPGAPDAPAPLARPGNHRPAVVVQCDSPAPHRTPGCASAPEWRRFPPPRPPR